MEPLSKGGVNKKGYKVTARALSIFVIALSLAACSSDSDSGTAPAPSDVQPAGNTGSTDEAVENQEDDSADQDPVAEQEASEDPDLVLEPDVVPEDVSVDEVRPEEPQIPQVSTEEVASTEEDLMSEQGTALRAELPRPTEVWRSVQVDFDLGDQQLPEGTEGRLQQSIEWSFPTDSTWRAVSRCYVDGEERARVEFEVEVEWSSAPVPIGRGVMYFVAMEDVEVYEDVDLEVSFPGGELGVLRARCAYGTGTLTPNFFQFSESNEIQVLQYRPQDPSRSFGPLEFVVVTVLQPLESN